MRSLLCAAALLVLLAAMAPADTILEREGELVADDQSLEDGRRVDWARANLVAGNRYLFSVLSDEIDTAVLVRFPDGVILSNDDFDGVRPALLYSAVRSEAVDVGVSMSEALEEGAYRLTVRTLPPARTVQSGQPVTQVFDSKSAIALEDGLQWMADSLLLSGARGERVTVRLASSDFDAYLRIQSRDGYAEENDDVEGTTDAELAYVFPQRGQIEVVVRPIDPTEGGEYTLSIERHGTAQSVDLGRRVSGTLTGGHEQYLLDGRRGQAVVVTVESDDIDPILQVVDRAGRRALNDDYGDGTDSRIHYLFAEDGTVSVTVSGQDEEDTGAFELSVEPMAFRADEHATKGRALEGDATIDGYLSAGASRRQDRYVHRYTFSAQAFELVRFEMSSESFDSYLELVGPEGFVASDDDSLGGYDALLVAACPVAGEYSLFASGAAEWETGFYLLSFERGGVVEPSLQEEAALEARDQRDISGRYFDAFSVEVEEGVSLVVDMSSEEFDAYLYVWDPQGESIYQDDDGGGDTNARVTVSGAAAGKWSIYATSTSYGETGSYVLRALAY